MMQPSEAKTIYTIGHSTHAAEVFISMLHAFEIKNLVDIRSFPGSRKFPQFNQENLRVILKEAGIQYIHLKDLGGRRKLQENSTNNRWRLAAFRAYADYMETESFQKAILQLEQIASQLLTAYMCSEAVWWRCHRSLVSDYLKAAGWTVWHIMSPGKATEHPYTSAARIVDGRLCYREDDLWS